MNYRPLHDRVIVQPIEDETVTPSGITIVSTTQKEPTAKGVVLAVGPGKPLDNGTVRGLAVSVGETVVFGRRAGTEVPFGIGHLRILREDDIMCVIPPSA